MRPWFFNLLLIGAVTVAAVKLFGSWNQPLPPIPIPPEPPAPILPAEPAPKEPPDNEQYRKIASRNLFTATRGVSPPAPVNTSAPVPKPAAPPPKYTLFGVVIEDTGEKTAFLQDSSKSSAAKPRRFREGDTVPGGKVKEIKPDRVTLTFAGSDVTVALRTPKQGVDTASRAPAAASPMMPVASEPSRGPNPTPSRPATVRRPTRPGRRPVPRVTRPRTRRPVAPDAQAWEEDFNEYEEQYLDDQGQYYEEDYDGEQYYEETEDDGW